MSCMLVRPVSPQYVNVGHATTPPFCCAMSWLSIADHFQYCTVVSSWLSHQRSTIHSNASCKCNTTTGLIRSILHVSVNPRYLTAAFCSRKVNIVKQFFSVAAPSIWNEIPTTYKSTEKCNYSLHTNINYFIFKLLFPSISLVAALSDDVSRPSSLFDYNIMVYDSGLVRGWARAHYLLP